MSETQRQKEMRILVNYRNARGEYKHSYFPVPKEKVSFVAIPTALLESSVWGSLGIYDRRFVDQILIVHARAGGVKNGYLRLTHLQLRAAGIEGDRIKPTIDNLVRLRLLEVMHQGGPADPSQYRVTFMPHRIEEVSGRVAVGGARIAMIGLAPGTKVFLACQPIDLRAGSDGLAAKVQQIIGADPFSGHVFLFRGKRGRYLKGLYWDGSGMCLFAKRLERGKFVWPPLVDDTMMLTPAQLALLIEAMDWRRTQHRRPRRDLCCCDRSGILSSFWSDAVAFGKDGECRWWALATAPSRLVKDAWDTRLMIFVLSHLAAGARALMLSHGVARLYADRFLSGGAMAAVLVAFAIMFGMCGARLNFAIP